MSGHNGSVRAVVVALGSNVIIAAIKFLVSIVTRSAGMMAEAVHSVADCGNQVFLLIGTKRSARKPTEEHPFGFGKEEYFWGFLVAVLLFFVGALFSIYEGVHKLFQPSELQNIGWSFVVLITSIVLEGRSFYVAYKTFKRTNKGTGMVAALRLSTDTNLLVILLEDSAALAGLVLVLISTFLAWAVHPVFDAIGSILVGILLILVSLFMTNELRKLIVGENIPRAMREDFRRLVAGNELIHKVNYISAMMMGQNRFILVIGINLEDGASAAEVEDQLELIRKSMHAGNPNIHSVFFDVRDLDRLPASIP